VSWAPRRIHNEWTQPVPSRATSVLSCRRQDEGASSAVSASCSTTSVSAIVRLRTRRKRSSESICVSALPASSADVPARGDIMQFEVNRADFHAALSDADRGRVDAVLDGTGCEQVFV